MSNLFSNFAAAKLHLKRMSPRHSTFIQFSCLAIFIIIVVIGLAKGCDSRSFNFGSSSSNDCYKRQQREFKESQERISKQQERDIRNHAEYYKEVPCSNCGGLGYNCGWNKDKTGVESTKCLVCNGKGKVYEKHRYGEDD